MKLLILTQKVDKNDPILGFFCGWVKEFARQCEKVTVICLERGEHDLAENIKVLSLGKEKRSSRLNYFLNFYKYIWLERKNYDAVFVHMTPIYIVLGGLPWRILRKKILLWYTHKSVDLQLRLAEMFTHKIFTASKESFRLQSKKVQIVGHGIDIERFKPMNQNDDDIFHIVTVGRISPVKDYETLISAIERLVKENGNVKIQVEIVGGPGTPQQQKYFEELVETVKSNKLDNIIKFIGPISNVDAVKYLQKAELFVNMSHTGSLDKAVLEAMACGVPVITSNCGLKSVLKDHSDLMFEPGNARELAGKITTIYDMSVNARKVLSGELISIVAREHQLSSLIQKILQSIYDRTKKETS